MDPARGREQAGHRPVLVLSPKKYNSKAGLLLGCPLTSKAKGYPFEVACKINDVEGVVLADHVRSMDWRTRGARFASPAPEGVVIATVARLQALIRT
jgi:mRNA interferase MazF